MRIFYAAGSSPNAYQISESNLWKNNLFDSLVDAGHEVIPFSRDVTWHFTEYRNFETSPSERRKFYEYRSFLQKELLREITAEHTAKKIDLFFSYFWSDVCEPETIEKIKSLGIETVNWFCNGSYQFDLIADLAPHFDWCLVPERFRLRDYQAVGARPLYCQEAANPKTYKPYNVPVEFDVTFVGQAYGDRPAYVRHLLKQEIDVRVWGPGWQSFSLSNVQQLKKPNSLRQVSHLMQQLSTIDVWRSARHRLQRLLGGGNACNPVKHNQQVISLPAEILGNTLSDIDMIQMYSRSKINLGFSTCGDTHISGDRILQIRLRDFEVPMSGGFYMVEYMEELEDFFDIGKEIVCYTDARDLSDKIKYYLRHDSEREAVRRAGYERCRRDHTWRKRFEMAFKEMKASRCVA